MQKIPVVTLPVMRPFKTNGFPQTKSSRNAYLQRFVQVFDDDFFKHIQTPTQHFPRSVNSKVAKRVHCLRWIIGPLLNANAIRKSSISPRWIHYSPHLAFPKSP
ncbi:hypothetical protein TNCV_1479831 [Trichonephila clavipes]|nr:hypothetical protein TNCV_1479831 [Trichonephila clavipes]